MSMARWANVWRYTHADPLREVDAPGLSHDYDGIGTVWHRSPEARQAHRSDLSAQQTMEQDERDTFATLVREFCAIYDEQLLVPPLPGARIKLVRFALEESDAAPAQAAIPVRGHVRNRRAPPEVTPWGLPYQQIDELWFDTAADAAAAQRSLPDSADAALIVAETVLYQLAEAS